MTAGKIGQRRRGRTFAAAERETVVRGPSRAPVS
jgi:hypothetical protein